MTKVKLTHAVADLPAGTVAEIPDDQARRLIRTGYAVPARGRPRKQKDS